MGGIIQDADVEKDIVWRTTYSGCLVCLLKAFARDYWGNKFVSAVSPFEPRPLPYTLDLVFQLHQLLQRYFCRDPPGHAEGMAHLRNMTPPMSEADFDEFTRSARRTHMTAPKDVEVLMARIWQGIEATFDTE
ncbi:hypothetical protein ACJQWK_01484 [Exserohilum turcicum]